MGQETTIEWCDHTFNPWIGCSKVSDGCKYCYAESQTYPRVSKARGLPLWGKDASRHRTSVDNWDGVLRWNRKAKNEREDAEQDGRPHQRPRVFCASLADIFEDHPALHVWRADLWELILATTEIDWMLLTKRPHNIRDMVPREWIFGNRHVCDCGYGCPAFAGCAGGNDPKWPSHVWVGASCENQEAADRRIPHLLRVPAPVRFLSCEPLLGPIKLGRIEVAPALYADALRTRDFELPINPINWVIVGGESGPNARHCAAEWIEDLAAQCADAGVAFFAKQLGDNRTRGGNRIVGAGPKGHDLEAAGLGFLPREWPQRRRG